MELDSLQFYDILFVGDNKAYLNGTPEHMQMFISIAEKMAFASEKVRLNLGKLSFCAARYIGVDCSVYFLRRLAAHARYIIAGCDKDIQ